MNVRSALAGKVSWNRLSARGRYNSASEVMREGLRLVEEREQKLAALRETIQASIARVGRIP